MADEGRSSANLKLLRFLSAEKNCKFSVIARYGVWISGNTEFRSQLQRHEKLICGASRIIMIMVIMITDENV